MGRGRFGAVIATGLPEEEKTEGCALFSLVAAGAMGLRLAPEAGLALAGAGVGAAPGGGSSGPLRPQPVRATAATRLITATAVKRKVTARRS